MTTKLAKLLSLGIILVHLGISTIHGLAHQGALVALTTFGYVYVLVVITLAPLIAGGLLFSRWARMGALLLAVSMFGSFVFGGWYHFLSATAWPGHASGSTSDNVAAVHGPWRPTFLWTAIALAVVEFCGMIIGVSAYRWLRTSPLRS